MPLFSSPLHRPLMACALTLVAPISPIEGQQTTQVPRSLICSSDGTKRQLTIAKARLPEGFTEISATIKRPVKRSGGYLLRIMITTDDVRHAAGLESIPFPTPIRPGPITGYGFKLTYNDSKTSAESNQAVLIVADEFRMVLKRQGSDVLSRVDWVMDGKSRSQDMRVAIAENDQKDLVLACFNGDFEISDLHVK